MSKNKTREQWLNSAAGRLAKLLKQHEAEVPEKTLISVGFPKGHGPRAIGQAWPPQQDAHHIFISPKLVEPIAVLGTLLHELIHVAVGCEHGHKGPFRKVARAVGLKGKLTATVVEAGTDLAETLEKMSEALGEYPHKALVPVASGRKTNNWVRVMSVNDERYKVVISPVMLEENGAPTDPWGDQMVLVE